MIFIKDTPFFLFCQDISICVCIYGFRVIKIQKTVAHGLLHQQNKTGRKLMNRNPLPFLFYLYNARTRFLVACFWKFFGNFLKKLMPSQIGSSAATAACAQGRIILRDVLREHRAPRLQSKHECRAE